MDKGLPDESGGNQSLSPNQYHFTVGVEMVSLTTSVGFKIKPSRKSVDLRKLSNLLPGIIVV